jgi:hypothetical protein
MTRRRTLPFLAIVGTLLPTIAAAQASTTAYRTGADGAVLCGSLTVPTFTSRIDCTRSSLTSQALASATKGRVTAGTAIGVDGSSIGGGSGAVFARATWTDQLSFSTTKIGIGSPATVDFLVQFYSGVDHSVSDGAKGRASSDLQLSFTANGTTSDVGRHIDTPSSGTETTDPASLQWLNVRTITIPYASTIFVEMVAEATSRLALDPVSQWRGWTFAESSRSLQIVGIQLRDAAGKDLTKSYTMTSLNGTRVYAVADLPEPGSLALVGLGLGLAALRRRGRGTMG